MCRHRHIHLMHPAPAATSHDVSSWMLLAGARSPASCREAPHVGKLIAVGKLTAGEELLQEVVRLPRHQC
jgi:hypothetical protein